MRSEQTTRRILTAFPRLPLAALGLWFAWINLAFNGYSWISSTDFNGIRVAQLFICFNVAMAVVLIAMQACVPRIQEAFRAKSFAIGGGLLASAGAFVIIAIGPYVFGPHFGIPVSMAVFLVASAVTGIGSALVFMKATDLFRPLLPRNAIVELAYVDLFALAMYFIASGVAVVPIGENGPGVFQAVMFVILPAIAGLFAAMEAPASPGDGDSCSFDRDELPCAFWRMTLVVGVLAFSESFVESFANLAVPLVDSVELFTFILLFQGFASLVFICFAVSYDDERHPGFGRIVNVTLAIVILAVALVSLAGSFSPAFYLLLPFVMRVFEFVYLCMLVFVAHQRRISALVVFGTSYGIFTACKTAGWALGTLLYPYLVDTSYLLLASGALSLLTLALAFVLFSEKQFDILFERVDGDCVPLSALMTRKLHPDSSTLASRGRFNIALDVVAEEFDLSKREKDVLRQLAMGHDASRIAEELTISWNTVRTHTRNIYAKLDVHSRQEVCDLVDSYKDR